MRTMPPPHERDRRCALLWDSAAAFGWYVLPAACAAVILTVVTDDDFGAFAVMTWIVVCFSVPAVAGAALRRMLHPASRWSRALDWLLRVGSVMVAAIPLLIVLYFVEPAWALAVVLVGGTTHWRAARRLEAVATGPRPGTEEHVN